MIEFVLAGGILFWLYILFVLVLLIAAVVNECDFCGAGVIILGAFFAHWCFLMPVDWLPQTAAGWALLILAYLPVGVLWSFFKFYITYKKTVRELIGRKAGWVSSRKIAFPALTDAEIASHWSDYVDRSCPPVWSMKSRITGWISCWPVSIVCYVFADLLSDLLSKIYDHFSGLYTRIADRLIAAAKR